MAIIYYYLTLTIFILNGPDKWIPPCNNINSKVDNIVIKDFTFEME